MRRAAALLLIALLAGCAGGMAGNLPATSRPETMMSDEFIGQDQVETAAKLLAIAADENDPRSPRMAQAVVALDRLGVQVADDSQSDPLGQWRMAMPKDISSPLRGRLLGPAYRSGTLAPGASLSTHQLFDGGKPAKVTLSSRNQAPLAVEVEAPGQNAICKTQPGTPRSCRWTPPFSSRYAITVRNSGKEPARYFLVIG